MGIEEILIEHYKQEGLEEGMEKGMEEGLGKGMEEGRKQKDLTFATNLIISTDFDDDKIANLVGVNLSFVQHLRQEILSH